VHCDELVSLPKPRLTRFVGRLDVEKLRALDESLMTALGVVYD
jgi:mRNA-degrading endonuclease toxin of MazEF toxin-antitoxin module